VDIPVGLRAELSLLVTAADTARAMGSGDVEVLATPRLVALCEQASCEALSGRLAADTTTVGMRVQIDHLQPTPVGATVTAEVVLDRIEGRRLSFTVSVSDAGGLGAAGRLTRVLVDRDRFLAKCCSTENEPSPA
jgi:predicted thioesterase